MSLERAIGPELDALYARIPRVENCKPGCTDCCGPVPFSLVEAARARVPAGLGACLECPYSLKGRCDVYAHRPLMCRLYAAVDDPGLTCPHGAKAATPLTRAEGNAIVDAYIQLQERERQLLPSVADELAELKARRRAKP